MNGCCRRGAKCSRLPFQVEYRDVMSSYSIRALLLLCGLISLTTQKQVPDAFRRPPSEAVDNVNPLIGNGGDTPNGSGGMIPSTSPPFAMTRWVAQTSENYVSVTPYNYTATSIHGFQGTHQPAIWMGESGQVVISPGAGQVQPKFNDRGMSFTHENEIITASYYSVNLNAIEGGQILAEQSSTSRVGHLRFTFTDTRQPYVLVEATRASVLGSSDPHNLTFPHGSISINPDTREISGSNPERQDFIIAPVSTPAKQWSGYFCARFDQPFASWGISKNNTLLGGQTSGNGTLLSGYATFSPEVVEVSVRIGVSFISVEQARKNLDMEIPDGNTLEDTATMTRSAWAEKLELIKIKGASEDQLQTFYTAFFHTLQYPYEQSEDGQYYSGYDDAVHEGVSYTGYSNWDTYRAEWAWLILFAPDRIPGMVQSMLQDYKEVGDITTCSKEVIFSHNTQGGRLPMWKNIIETNIMVATHADSLIAEAVLKGMTGFDLETAWEAVYNDATVPPVNDTTTVYFDREENVDYEVRAGLTSVYEEKGWVADDIHSESASRTLDYSYDDFAVSVLAGLLNKSEEEQFFRTRSLQNPFTIFNSLTGFMEARNASGAWAGPDNGWTEGDKWAYTFDVVHDTPELIAHIGGNATFVDFLDEHFDGGHNDHTNEPSHHIPYLYSLAGAASKSQSRIRQIAESDYNASVNGLSGNEDCGQMSAWYLFSALGFYPVNPVSGLYVVGSPFFDQVEIQFPLANVTSLKIISKGAPSKPFVNSFTINGEDIPSPIISHNQLLDGGRFEFIMSSRPQAWGSSTLFPKDNTDVISKQEKSAQYYVAQTHLELR
ncbi:glycoside hydrolase family 92 protein [Suillus clintonianus]|uniref:glycoside hydrolase family 92 protein n=1 Tax=Suillus clintonianus TaxID=1904413 RepID=UPI001B86EBDB|nr:glycoside hydrolase family 92 protein [Suillus clintonianus]KAG2132096.1 glycoside hydrolase family 92 protein [Suillus clintonianus]